MIEGVRIRISPGGHQDQLDCAPRTRLGFDVLHELTPNPVAAIGWIDKQLSELGRGNGIAQARQQAQTGHANNRAIRLSDKSALEHASLTQMRRDMLRRCAQVVKGRIQADNCSSIIRHSRTDDDLQVVVVCRMVRVIPYPLCDKTLYRSMACRYRA